MTLEFLIEKTKLLQDITKRAQLLATWASSTLLPQRSPSFPQMLKLYFVLLQVIVCITLPTGLQATFWEWNFLSYLKSNNYHCLNI